MIRRHSILSMTFAVMLYCSGTTKTASADDAPDGIDVLLNVKIVELYDMLYRQNYRTIGLLPFKLQVAGQTPGFDGATIQRNISDRIEQAFLAYHNRDNPLLIVRNAIDQAVSNRVSLRNLTTRDKNGDFEFSQEWQQLFDMKYDLWVKGEPVKVDAFITGQIVTDSLFLDCKITFQIITKTGKAYSFKPFVVPTDREMLVQLGRGFTLFKNGGYSRGATSDNHVRHEMMESFQDLPPLDESSEEDGNREFTSKAGKDDISEYQTDYAADFDPWAGREVRLSVLFDGQQQSLKPEKRSSTSLLVPDPSSGQNVTFKLTNQTDKELAAVLSINGVSTFAEQSDMNPDDCRRWVLQPGKEYVIKGFWLEDGSGVKPCKVLDDSETDEYLRQFKNPYNGFIRLHVWGPSDGIEIEAKKRRKRLVTVNTNPPDATLSVEGKTLIPSNGKIKLPPGENNIQMKKEGYITTVHTVTIPSTGDTKLNLTMRKQPGTINSNSSADEPSTSKNSVSDVRIKVAPTDAIVRHRDTSFVIDDSVDYISLPIGQQKISVEKSGYRPVSVVIDVKPDAAENVVDLSLKPINPTDDLFSYRGNGIDINAAFRAQGNLSGNAYGSFHPSSHSKSQYESWNSAKRIAVENIAAPQPIPRGAIVPDQTVNSGKLNVRQIGDMVWISTYQIKYLSEVPESAAAQN